MVIFSLSDVISSLVPPKNKLSVSIDIALEFASSYPNTTFLMSAFRLIEGLDGDFLLNSDITPDL